MTNDIKMNTATPASSKKKKRRGASLIEKKDRLGWIFILPFLIGFVFLYAGVVFESISYSFAQYNIIPAIKGGGYNLTFVGFDNFSEQLMKTVDNEGKTFIEMIFTSFANQIIDVVIILMFSLFIAVVLNQKMLGRAAFRAIFFVPVIIATGLMESINGADIMSGSMSGGLQDGSGQEAGGGIVNVLMIENLFKSMAIGGNMVNYVVTLVNDIYNIINYSGVQMLIFLAGLQSISDSIYEACRIDGATGWETFWKVTFPMISPMILVNSVYTVIDSFTRSSNVTMAFIKGSSSDYSQAAAMYWIYFGVVILIIAAVAGIASTFIFYQRRD